MKIFITAVLFTVVLVFLPADVFTQICRRLNPSLFQRCINVGYNYTAHFPDNFNSHENTIGYHLEREARRFKQCSEYLDVIMCAIFVPKCVEHHDSPVLPCRRICEQFVKDCESRVDFENIEWIKGLCRLLPTTRNNENLSECFEPANYKPRDNISITIIQNCTKLQMSSCSHLGYTHTTQGKDMQLIMDNVLKGKLHKLGNHSGCSSTLKKIFCTEFAPPCFPLDKEKIVLRTVCKSDCENVKRECPELYREHFGEYYHCEQMATEKSDLEGFCKLTKWPTAGRWATRQDSTSKPKDDKHMSTPPSFRLTVSTPSSTPPSGGSFVPSPVPLHSKVSTPVIVIAMATVFIAMSIIGIVAVLMSRKRRRFIQGCMVRGYHQQLNEWKATVT